MYIVFITGVASRFPPTQLHGRALWMLRKTAESQTLSYVLWLATFHCLETPFCLFLLGFLLASPIASSLLLVMLQWATWRGEFVLPFVWWQLVWASPFAAQQLGSDAQASAERNRSLTFQKRTMIFFLFCCLCQPIIGSSNKMTNKQTNK